MQKFLFARIEVWVLLAVILLGALGLVGFGGAVIEHTEGRHRLSFIGKAAVAVARVPLTIETVLRNENPMWTPRQDRFDGQSGWTWDKAPTADGYWLMSWFDVTRGRSVIDMVRLSDGSVTHQWLPDFGTSLAGASQQSKVSELANWRNGKFKVYVPYLTPDGALVVKSTDTPLIAYDGCARQLWLQDGVMFHHSTESDGAGGLWVPSVIEPTGVKGVSQRFEDDGLSHVGADGAIIETISLTELMLRHGLQHLVFQVGNYDDDPLHLNDIQPVLSDGPWWKKGDLFLSLRHRSLVMLYRPSTDEIVWMQQGPWMGQHDVDILDDHRIAVFNNRAQSRTNGVGTVDGTSEILIHDFATGTTTSPYHDAMAREKVGALFEGLYTFLPSGELVIEDHNSGRILFLAADGSKLGQFINRNPDGKVYEIGWGRYIDQASGDAALQIWQGQSCSAG